MQFKSLDVILKHKRGKVIAVVRQITQDGLVEGANLLGKKSASTFAEAKTLVHLKLNGQVETVNFIEEQQEGDWER